MSSPTSNINIENLALAAHAASCNRHEKIVRNKQDKEY